jgi:hypothetical protein
LVTIERKEFVMARTVQPNKKSPQRVRVYTGGRGAKKPESWVPMGRFGNTPPPPPPLPDLGVDRSADRQAGIDGDCTGIQNV